MRNSSSFPRLRRHAALVAAIAIASPIAFAPHPVAAEGLFDFFFGGAQKQQQQAAQPQASFFADPFTDNPAPRRHRRAAAVASYGPSFCVRTCDGRYFPLMRAAASPVQMCQSFCPASATKVYFGSSIDGATR